jgi:hypothetical protein
MTFTNVTAAAVNTIEWLFAANTTIAGPVCQRQYRWEIDGCEQLLANTHSFQWGCPADPLLHLDPLHNCEQRRGKQDMSKAGTNTLPE